MVSFGPVILLALLLAFGEARGAEPALTVAISIDVPPYVMKKATSGLEVDVIREALPDHQVRFVQMPYAELQTAVPSKRAEVAAGVRKFGDDGVHYSADFATFENVAIAKKAAGLRIDGVGDLAGHRVLAWQDAYRELGPEFERLFAPGAAQRESYVEVGDQREQVRMFWSAEADVLVIDRVVFDYFSAELGHSTADATLHWIFPPVTNFRVGFADASRRDAFDAGLARLCASGRYAELLARYRIRLRRTICER